MSQLLKNEFVAAHEQMFPENCELTGMTSKEILETPPNKYEWSIVPKNLT